MKKTLLIALSLFHLAVYGQDSAGVKKDSVPATPWALYHAIEARLDTVLDDDQSARRKLDEFSKQHNTRRSDSLWKVIRKKDDANLAKVKDILDKYGWLGIDEIGEKANLALFLVIQHADSLTQVTYLPMMRLAVKDGKAKAEHLALLEDRVLTNQGKPQIYGSQVRTNRAGKNEFFPIGDEGNVNKRRAAVGLEPLEEYARNFGIDYHLPK
ncbi:hypothetical protein Q4E93_31680 [Flavitalea sp. BT771]|uniref:DUF6624 domain-containing protein n=1 Tax=Flavitalea sp. BT771 TaxID=3063329 RepID=UPI0026E3958D|nr:DUF6624 domain-containing protein [Flavitalea sp. BT771]MDO6435220.1 hypothetical protein [Flavitalea sp. BT771]MDV6224075.1 DUF6624 domain-containing protein [Flavitalea sp. BT771]